MTEEYSLFDLKITKLTGNQWNRLDFVQLLYQLYEEQGEPRYSIENRIVIAFDESRNSSAEFWLANWGLIVGALVNIAADPAAFSYQLPTLDCWGSIVLIPRGIYQSVDDYHEHLIGSGMREDEKAKLSIKLLKEVSQKSAGLIKANEDTKQHGIDGELLIDIGELSLLHHRWGKVFPLREIPICIHATFLQLKIKAELGDGCRGCELYFKEHCFSRGAQIFRANATAEENDFVSVTNAEIQEFRQIIERQNT